MPRRTTRNSRKQPSDANSSNDNDEISEADQWRIIEQSGILKKVPREEPSEPLPNSTSGEEENSSVFWDEIFNASLILIPMASILLIMEILVHYQYGRKPSWEAVRNRMIPGVPILSVFIFYTNRYKKQRRMQFLFFLIASFTGPRLIWLVNRANWRMVMQQAPPVAVTWIYSVFQLDLAPSVLSLVLIAAWVKITDMKIII